MENQENKITLDEIYNEITKRTSDAVKKTYLNKVIKVKSHVSYVQREVIAKQIIDTAHFSIPADIDITKLTDEELNNLPKVPTINHSAQYVLSALMLVDLYTNVKIDFKQGAFQYDKLVETGVINYVLDNVPESEINEFKMLIDYKYEEYYQRYFSIKSYIDSKLKNFESIISILTDTITTSLDKIDKDEVKEIIDAVKDKKINSNFICH